MANIIKLLNTLFWMLFVSHSFINGQYTENFSEDYQSLLDSVYVHRNQDVEKFKSTIDILIMKTENNNDYYLSKGYRELGFYYIILTEYEKALREISKAEEIAIDIGNETLLVEALMFRGLVEIDIFEYSNALKTFNKIRDLSRKLGLSINDLEATQMIATVYQRSKDFDQALEYYLQCEPNLDLEKPSENEGWWAQNIAELYYLLGDLQSSEFYYEKSLDIWNSLDMNRGEIYSYNGLAELFLEKGDLSAINYFRGAIVGNTKLNIYPQRIRSYTGAAKYYSKLRLEKDSIIHYYSKVIDVAIENDLEHLAADAIDYAIENFRYFKNSLNYYLHLKIISQQKLLEVRINDDVKIAAATEKLKNSEALNGLIIKQNRTFKKMLHVIGSGAFCSLILLVLLYKNYKNLKISQSTVRSQFDVIDAQRKELESANHLLKKSNIRLNSDIENRDLELLNTKNVISKIDNVRKGENIAYIKSLLKKEIDEEFWKENAIINRFKDQEIAKKLYNLNSKLTNTDILVCSMIINGLSTKDISKVTNKSIDAVKTSRSRLRKKLDVGKSENLSAFLNRLSLQHNDEILKTP